MATALRYNGDHGGILLCKVLVGREYRCQRKMVGAPLQRGFDSHLSPCETENVIFEAAQILPCYYVIFAPDRSFVAERGQYCMK